jgi:hypothetical protein
MSQIFSELFSRVSVCASTSSIHNQCDPGKEILSSLETSTSISPHRQQLITRFCVCILESVAPISSIESDI